MLLLVVKDSPSEHNRPEMAFVTSSKCGLVFFPSKLKSPNLKFGIFSNLDSKFPFKETLKILLLNPGLFVF